MSDQNNHHCKKCSHLEKVHFTDYATQGGWVYLDDIKEEVWQDESYVVTLCSDCGDECVYEQMTNLEYLEWKYETRNK